MGFSKSATYREENKKRYRPKEFHAELKTEILC